MGVSLKGATQIKTLACLKKSGASGSGRHVRHFQVASLEIERTRRLKERRETVSRLEATDQRLREIEELLRGHHEALGFTTGDGAPGDGTTPAFGGTSRGHHLIGAGDDSMDEPRAPGPRRMLVYGR